ERAIGVALGWVGLVSEHARIRDSWGGMEGGDPTSGVDAMAGSSGLAASATGAFLALSVTEAAAAAAAGSFLLFFVVVRPALVEAAALRRRPPALEELPFRCCPSSSFA